jgi:O-antigen/teichoic acid export membrane protein
LPDQAGAVIEIRTAPRRRTGMRARFAGNVAARVGALVALALATIMVARAGGPALVGTFSLLRVLPGLAGVLMFGLPGAAPYFLASRPDDRRMRPTLVAVAVLGAGLATLGWLLLTPVLHQVFFHRWGVHMVAAASTAVFTQLFVAVGKSFLQGTHDLRGANAAIFAEEAAFPPIYAVLLRYGDHGAGTLLTALVIADVLVAWGIYERLRRAGFFQGWGRSSVRLGREICWYGTRGQVGGVLSLINLRLDVAILGAFAGPALVGVYAVASKYAELLRLPGLAITYVLYPSFARRDGHQPRERTRGLLAPALGLNVLAAIPLAFAAAPVLPLLYGHGFATTIRPAWILIVGLLGEGVAGVVTAFLYGIDRPGINSLAIGAGVVVTVVVDIALIPRYGVIGAAIASTVAYLITDVTLLVSFWRIGRRVA